MDTWRRYGWLIGLACACGPSVTPGDDGGGDDGDSTGPASTSADSADTSTTGKPQTTAASTDDDEGSSDEADTNVDGASTGLACDVRQCDDLCPDECETEIVCTDFLIECSCACPTQCDIDEVACDLADASKTPPEDCGIVTPEDDLSAWEAVRTCVLERSANSEAFKGVFHVQGIDSFPAEAYVGQVGFVYALSRLGQDLGGIPGVTTVGQSTCTSIDPVPGCEVTTESPCLQCTDANYSGPACGP